MAIRKFKCGHSRTIQPYKDGTVHKIESDCPACQVKEKKLQQVVSQATEHKGKMLKLS